MVETGLRTGYTIRESGAYRDHQIRLSGDAGSGCRARNPDTTQQKFRLFAHDALARKGLGDGNAAGFGETLHLLPRLRVVHPASRNEQRALRLLKESDRLLDPLPVRQPPFDPPGALLEKVHRIIIGLGLHVLGQGESYRSGIGRIGQHSHRFRQSRQQLFGTQNTIEEAAHRAEAVVDAHIGRYRMLELLQHRSLVATGVIIGRQQKNGPAVDRGGRRSRNHVGRARTDRRGARQGGQAPPGPGKAAGCVDHSLLVAGLVIGQLIAVLIEGLPQPCHVAVAEYAE